MSAGIALHGQDVWQPVASMLSISLTYFSLDTLVALERIGWWLSIGSILVFIPYFPLSKHIHLIAAPINHLLKPKRTSQGALPPIDFEDEDIQELGVQRIEQLGQSQLIDAFACIMCNRCQDVCPVGEDYEHLLKDVLDPVPEDTEGKQSSLTEMLKKVEGGNYSPQSRWIGKLIEN